MTWGVDYASVDGNKPPDWKAFIAAGGSFAWLRASFAYYDKFHEAWTLTSDPTFWRDWDAIPAEIVRGAYMGPAIMASHSPEEQVAVFARAIKNKGGLRPGIDLPPCIDAEFPQGIAGTGLTRTEIVAWLARAAVAIGAELGMRPIIYTSGRVWNDSDSDCLGNPPAPPELVACDLWLARYAYKTRRAAVLPPPANLPAPPVPTPWGDEWIAHQDQGDAIGVPGFTATTDVDRFRVARPGDRGGHVLRIRAALGNPNAISGSPSTLFDAALEAAVKSFQANNGLVADGVVGLRTYCRLSSKI